MHDLSRGWKSGLAIRECYITVELVTDRPASSLLVYAGEHYCSAVLCRYTFLLTLTRSNANSLGYQREERVHIQHRGEAAVQCWEQRSI